MARKTDQPTDRTVQARTFTRMPIKTKILTPEDDIIKTIKSYTEGKREDGDLIVISESVIAIMQGRAIPVKEMKIGLLARFLWRFVSKVPYGIGLRSPYSMQCAVNEAGHCRILFAAIIGGITRTLGRKGDFYRIAGKKAATIDAAFTSPVPPYDQCVIMGPDKPDDVAQQLYQATGCPTAIMDINDIGGSWVLGCSDKIEKKLMEEMMNDNPLGQKDELTPIGIIREKTGVAQ